MRPPVFNKFDTMNEDFKSIGKMLWVYIGLSFLFSFLMGLFEIYSNTILYIVTFIVTVIAIYYGKTKTKFVFERRLFDKNFEPKDLGKCFLILTGFSAIALFFITIFSSILIFILGRSLPQADLDMNTYSFAGWIAILYVCIVGPILEELMFRGVILRTLSKYNAQFAIIASSIIFGLFHLYLEQGAHAIVIGLVFAYVSLKYDSLLMPILMHMMHNTLVSMASLSYGFSYVVDVFRIGCLVYVIYWLSKEARKLIEAQRKEIPAYPFYSKLFMRASFICLCILFVIETIISFIGG